MADCTTKIALVIPMATSDHAFAAGMMLRHHLGLRDHETDAAIAGDDAATTSVFSRDELWGDVNVEINGDTVYLAGDDVETMLVAVQTVLGLPGAPTIATFEWSDSTSRLDPGSQGGGCAIVSKSWTRCVPTGYIPDLLDLLDTAIEAASVSERAGLDARMARLGIDTPASTSTTTEADMPTDTTRPGFHTLTAFYGRDTGGIWDASSTEFAGRVLDTLDSDGLKVVPVDYGHIKLGRDQWETSLTMIATLAGAIEVTDVDARDGFHDLCRARPNHETFFPDPDHSEVQLDLVTLDNLDIVLLSGTGGQNRAWIFTDPGKLAQFLVAASPSNP